MDAAFDRAVGVEGGTLKFSAAELLDEQFFDLLSQAKSPELSELYLKQRSPSLLLKAMGPNYQRHFLFSLKLSVIVDDDQFISRFSILFLNFSCFDQLLLDYHEYVQNVNLQQHFLTKNPLLLNYVDVLFENVCSVSNLLFVDVNNTSSANEGNVVYFNELVMER